MVPKTIISLLLAASTAVGYAIPPGPQERDAGRSELVPQAQAWMTAYKDSYWSGQSHQFLIEAETECYGFGGTEWNNTIRSVRVAPEFRCRLWE
ncbi:hypothetical protein F4777DRAFT_575612 [Nemania sp. FL0916]|nr:hypothetical protein F4777DRAFT_575612 [Nemania sp. FL0916]